MLVVVCCVGLFSVVLRCVVCCSLWVVILAVVVVVVIMVAVVVAVVVDLCGVGSYLSCWCWWCECCWGRPCSLCCRRCNGQVGVVGGGVVVVVVSCCGCDCLL